MKREVCSCPTPKRTMQRSEWGSDGPRLRKERSYLPLVTISILIFQFFCSLCNFHGGMSQANFSHVVGFDRTPTSGRPAHRLHRCPGSHQFPRLRVLQDHASLLPNQSILTGMLIVTDASGGEARHRQCMERVSNHSSSRGSLCSRTETWRVRSSPSCS